MNHQHAHGAKIRGVVPKGHPSIGAPGALYAVDFIHHTGKPALLPACGGQIASRSCER